MSDYLAISVTFLDCLFHGRTDGSEPEWPPSPLRLMQAIVSANADAMGSPGDLEKALQWLEGRSPPLIVAPENEEAAPYRLSVPNNAMDIVGKAWAKGNYFGGNDASPATHRTMKMVRPIRMIGNDTVYYLWELDGSGDAAEVDAVILAARCIVALGWGIDLVVADGRRISSAVVEELPGERWMPTLSRSDTALRVPVSGTLDALRERHKAFLHRVGDTGFVPVAPLVRFDVKSYRRTADPIMRPVAVFELRHDDGTYCRYSQRRLMHIAGMVRHLAKDLMLQSPPRGTNEDWVETYVAGHRDGSKTEHRQFSYLPVPSIGHTHADQSIRRVMVAAPPADAAWLDHLARRLAGRRLEPETGDEFGDLAPPTLVRVYRDSVASRYMAPANEWTSVTPVILPGHDDRKAAKTRKLIEACLDQSGVEQPCTYTWRSAARFPNSLPAHKRDRDGRANFFLPRYLQTKSSIHLTLRFNDDLKVSGPITIGAGRHLGFGLMAAT